MNLLIVLPIALAILAPVQGKSASLLKHKDAKCDLKKADRCTQILYVYGDSNYQMSNTVEEAEQFCNLTREAEICVRNFASNCVKPFARQYINLMLAGPTHVLRKRCSHTGIKKYLEHKECINATKSRIDVCNDNAIRDTMRILKAKKEDWIPLSCCFISKSTQCSTSAISEEEKCDDRSRTYMREAIKGYSGEVFDLFCGNDLLWDSHNCKKVTKNLPVDAKSKKPLSVLPIVLDMMERF